MFFFTWWTLKYLQHIFSSEESCNLIFAICLCFLQPGPVQMRDQSEMIFLPSGQNDMVTFLFGGDKVPIQFALCPCLLYCFEWT
jgi:hypothetical protein